MSYYFGKSSKYHLASCKGDLQTLFNEVIKHIDCAVICGYRGEEAQNKAYREGNSKLIYPESKHNQSPSMAADVIPYPVDWLDIDRFIELGEIVKEIAERLYNEGEMKYRIVWGGDWERFKDYPHYELKI